MKRALGIFMFCLMSSLAWCVCQVPQPRMVCAEYFQSKAVVIAKLVGIISVPQDYPDHFLYKLVVIRQLRGQVSQTFEVYEGNDSGRASFDWKLDHKYLLFLYPGNAMEKDDWIIDGCGNSTPLADADAVLRKIQVLSPLQKNGLITGMVGTDIRTDGVPGVTIKISSAHHAFIVKTDAEGKFGRIVPVGTYQVTATKDETEIPPEPFSYEDPSHVVIAPSGCAQVQFADEQH